MSLVKTIFTPQEREKLKKRIKELEDEINRLKNKKEGKEESKSNNLEDLLC